MEGEDEERQHSAGIRGCAGVAAAGGLERDEGKRGGGGGGGGEGGGEGGGVIHCVPMGVLPTRREVGFPAARSPLSTPAD